METNYEHAKRFVEILTGSAESANTYQVRPERPGCSVRPEVVHGRIDELWPRFERDIQAGAAVSITINETDLQGRTERNVTKVRALFIDDDGEMNLSIEQLAERLFPSAIVQGKRGIHAYWVLSDFLQLGDFGWRQQGLAAHLGTDTAVKDLARCMRLPGTVNWKDPANPVLVTLAFGNDFRYAAKQIVEAFPAPPVEKRESDVDEEEAERRLNLYDPEERYRQAKYYIENQAPSAIQGSNGRNTTLAVIWSLYGYGLDEDQIQELAELYNDTKCDPSWPSDELRRIVDDGEGRDVPGSRLWKPREERQPKGAAKEAAVSEASVAVASEMIAESKQAVAIRYVRDYSERLFGIAGELSLNTRSGQIKVGDRLLEVGEGMTLARANLGRIPDAVYQEKKNGPMKVAEVNREDMKDAIVHVARARSYDPVRAYLEGLPAWDGVDRSQGLLEALHVEEPKPLHRAMLRKTLIAAVARVFEPGCKVDTICVLQAQDGGEFKSTFWRKIFGDEFFSDTKLDIEHNPKDAMQKIDRFWIHEWSEMAALQTAKSAESIKAFLSSQKDDYRAPYAAIVTTHPRRSMFVGTCNEAVLLSDNGGNRRFWIIPNVGEIDLQWVERTREQLLAQAVAEYRRGEQWWLTKAEQAEQTVDVRAHMHEAPGTAVVRTFVAGKTEVTTAEILKACDMRTFCPAGKVSETKAGTEIGKIMKALGWRKSQVGKERRAGYVLVERVDAATLSLRARGGAARSVFGTPKYNWDDEPSHGLSTTLSN